MPAQRLINRRRTTLFKYDVVAQDAAGGKDFIAHVGLSAEECAIALNEGLLLIHMGPPLEWSEDRVAIQACGSVGLNVSESEQIRIFVEEHLSEYEAEKIRGKRQYVIMPHCAEPNARCSVRRFNCAGFVIEAYRYAKINLIDTDLDSLPKVSLETLCHVYPPRMAQMLQNARIREEYGLHGEGPWPIVLAGYVLNALNRPAERIRSESYSPRVQDGHFLPRPKAGEVDKQETVSEEQGKTRESPPKSD